MVATLLLGAAGAAVAQDNPGPDGGPAGTLLDAGNKIVYDGNNNVYHSEGGTSWPEPYLQQYLADVLGNYSIVPVSVIDCGSEQLWATNHGLAVTGEEKRALGPNANIRSLVKCHGSDPKLGDLFFATDGVNLYVILPGPKGCFDSVEKIPINGEPTGTQGLLLGMFIDCVKVVFSSRSESAAMSPVIYLGYGGAGVYRSTDGGHTFAAANNGIPGSFPYGNVFVSSSTSLFVGTNAGIYKSADGGSNWTSASSGLPSQKTIRALEVSGNTLYAGTSGLPVALGVPDNGIFRSIDDGSSWQATNFKNRTDFSINSLVASGSSLYAATSTGLYVSTDGFSTWTP